MGTVNYLLADMISRIKVSYINRRSCVTVLNSKFCLNVLNVLLQEGYINEYEIKNQRILISLKYANGSPIIKALDVITTPRKKVFINAWHLKNKYQQSFVLVSTTKGIITKEECIKKNLGGLILLRISY